MRTRNLLNTHFLINRSKRKFGKISNLVLVALNLFYLVRLFRKYGRMFFILPGKSLNWYCMRITLKLSWRTNSGKENLLHQKLYSIRFDYAFNVLNEICFKSRKVKNIILHHIFDLRKYISLSIKASWIHAVCSDFHSFFKRKTKRYWLYFVCVQWLIVLFFV